MDKSILTSLAISPTRENQAKAVQYFEELKNSEGGWQICLKTLSSSFGAGDLNDNYNTFFCLQVIEHYAKTRYRNSSNSERMLLREFLKSQHQWSQYNESHAFIRNKIAQIVALIFIQDYPLQWPSFFDELISTLSIGESSIDHFLRVCLAIDSEIADRDIPRNAEELKANSIIKDAMRENCILNLVDAWYKILGLEKNQPLVRQCLYVIGAFIKWIDINAVANDRFVSILVEKLRDPDLREASADCIHDIISKGMDPRVKWKLVESFFTVLSLAEVWRSLQDINCDSEYLIKLGKVLNCMGINLIDSFQKVLKESIRDPESIMAIDQAITSKQDLCYEFLAHEDDDVSASVLDFIRDYLHLLKTKPTLTDFQRKCLDKILNIVLKKIRFDERYNFDHEGEDEALFQEYRKQLKIVFDNVALTDKSVVIEHTQQALNSALSNWRQIPFEDVEAALLIFFYLSELPQTGAPLFHPDLEKSSPIQQMLFFIHNSDIQLHSHPSVVYQYFETIVRFEKFYNCHPDYIMKVLSSFLENNGLFHRCKKIRSRATYLFSRFIKGIRPHLTPELTNSIIHAIGPLLVVKIPNKDLLQTEELLLSDDDQLYLYEVVGIIIIAGEKSSQKREEYIRQVIKPLLETVRIATIESKESDKEQRGRLAAAIVQAISLTGRISKAFSNQQSMKSCGSIPIFLEALQVFLRALDTSDVEHHSIIQSGVRQYLHRMVVCMEEELLPYIPLASQELLKNCDCKTIQEYIPLINQVISKFKQSWVFQKDVTPFLQQIFAPMVQSIFSNLAIPIESNDMQAQRERQLLQRMYFQFIATIVVNNVIEVLSNQNHEVLDQVMTTIIQGSVDFPDPVAQKSCFSTLKKLVELWGGLSGPDGFIDFIYKQIVPACFAAPMKPTFDFADGQTIIVLNEIASCIRAIFDKRKEELIIFLQNHYLPSLNLSPQVIHEYLTALQSNNSTFKSYIKGFFQDILKKQAVNR